MSLGRYLDRPLSVTASFNANGSDRDGYESYVGPLGSRSRDKSSLIPFDFAKTRRMRIAGSWFQRPDRHRWTRYFNRGWCKEREQPCNRRRSLETQNCSIIRGTAFAGTSNIFIMATLKLWLKSRKMAPSNQVRLDVCRL